MAVRLTCVTLAPAGAEPVEDALSDIALLSMALCSGGRTMPPEHMHIPS